MLGLKSLSYLSWEYILFTLCVDGEGLDTWLEAAILLDGLPVSSLAEGQVIVQLLHFDLTLLQLKNQKKICKYFSGYKFEKCFNNNFKHNTWDIYSADLVYRYQRLTAIEI